MARTLIGNVKGPKGDKGDTGATGAQGIPASIQVGSVSSLAYGNNPTVTNSGSEQNVILNFGIPAGRPANDVTNMDDLTVDAMVTSSASFPVPVIGDTGKVIFGKISKWFSDMASLVATKLDASKVYNDLDKTESGYALDARQGKALDDKVDQVGDALSAKVNQIGGALHQYYASGITISTTEQAVIESDILEPGVYLVTSGLMANTPENDLKLLSTSLNVFQESSSYQTALVIGVDCCRSKSSHLAIMMYSQSRFKVQLKAVALDQSVGIIGDGRFNYLHVGQLRLF